MQSLKRVFLSIILCMSLVIPCWSVDASSELEKDLQGPAGYLAVYVAVNEYNMGVEYAQFPSGKYTDTCRTDVLYYGLSKNGVDFEGMNHDKAVYYPKGFHQLGSPSVFRKADGSYGLIASLNNASPQIFLSDSTDLIFFENERVLTLNDKGIAVKNPMVEYSGEEEKYHIYWEGGDGNSYLSVTEDFSSFTEPQKTEYKKEEVSAGLPSYALKEEASIFELTQEEYDRIARKYGTVESTAVRGAEDRVVKTGEKLELPEQVDVVYSDNSTAKMGVDWDLSGSGLDPDNPAEGTYLIHGTIKNHTYHSPLAKFRADPFIAYNEAEGMYYLTGSNLNEKSAAGGGAYNTIVLRRAETINGLTEAQEVDIWKNKTIQMPGGRKDVITGWYWAPELHYIGGKWRILAMGTVKSTVNGKEENNGWAQCVFTCEGEDLMESDNWKYEGYIGETTDGQKVGAFDTTFFEYGGQCYYVTPRDTKIFITTVDPEDLTVPTGPRVQISGPDRAFERNLGSGQDIEEGPGVLLHDGKVFVTYSCATVDMHYGVCLVYADLEDDLMDPASWHKYQAPLLTTADLTTTVKPGVFTGMVENGEYKGTFGPGHNSFTVDDNGNPVIVYHARDWEDSYPGATGENKYGLTDPGRHAYVNSVHFGADGFPIFNMTPEQILSDDLKQLNMTITVKNDPDGKGEPAITEKPQTPVPNTGKEDINTGNMVPKNAGNGNTVSPAEDKDGDRKKETPPVKKGRVYTVAGNRYRMLDVKKRRAAFAGLQKKNRKALVIPSAVKIKGGKYTITEISPKACLNCRKLKKIRIQSKKLKKAGAKAFRGISQNAVIAVPKEKTAVYKKLLKKTGLPKKARITGKA